MADNSTQTIYSTNTNTQTPDPASLAYRNSTLPLVTAAATTQPNIYGMKFVPAELDEKGFPKAGTGVYVRDPSVPLTAAPTNADIESANARIRSTDVTPWLNKASGQLDQAAGTDIAGANQGLYQVAANTNFGNSLGSINQAKDLYGAAANGNSAAAGAGEYDNATGLYNASAAAKSGAAGQGQFNAATGLYDKAANTNLIGAYDPFASSASSLYGQSTAPTGLSAASPYLNAASGSTADNISAYMNPYNAAVTDQIAKLGARNLSENILPAIGDQFVSSGQWGSTRQGELSDRALRDTQENILAQQSAALQAGYTTAGNQYATDAARQAGLAGTAGGLGTAQQSALQGAAAGLSNVGSTSAGLGATQAGLGLQAATGLQGIGNTNIQASQADLNRQIQAAQGIESIGASKIQASQADLARQIQAATGLNTAGMSQAQIAQMAAQLQLNAGQGLTGAAASGAANQVATGTANQNLAQTGQNLALQGASAQLAVGEDQRAQDNARIAAEQGATNGAQGAILNNLTAGAGAASATPGSVVLNQSSGSQTQPPASTLGQLAGAAGTIIGGVNLLNKAKGGPVKKNSLSKASYGNVPRRGLGMFQRAS